MKYLGVILILCLGTAVKAAAFDALEDDDTAINVTLIPLNETTTVSPITLNPASVPTNETTTPGSAIPVTIITIKPSTAATIGPVITTQSSSPPNNPTPAPKTHGFDGASFGGGIALGVGVCIVFIVVYAVYSRKNTKGYNTM